MKKVLIAENDETLRKVIDIILMDKDFELLFASTGSQALEMAQMEAPDVIVTKIKLPEVNGLEILRRLKSEEVTAGIPVILVATNDELPDIKQVIDSGASAHITKPFSPMKFLAQIDFAMKENQHE